MLSEASRDWGQLLPCSRNLTGFRVHWKCQTDFTDGSPLLLALHRPRPWTFGGIFERTPTAGSTEAGFYRLGGGSVSDQITNNKTVCPKHI